MEIAFEIFHIEFWQISGTFLSFFLSGTHILIVKKIRNFQKWYICQILKFEFRNDAGWQNFWVRYF
jgi:hypothetical protein